MIAQQVEQSAVNRSVVGSSPTQGANLPSRFGGEAWGIAKSVRHGTLTPACVGSSPAAPATFDPLAQSVEHLTFNQGVPRSSRGWITTSWRVGQAVKTPPFHGGYMGSNPIRVTIWY